MMIISSSCQCRVIHIYTQIRVHWKKVAEIFDLLYISQEKNMGNILLFTQSLSKLDFVIYLYSFAIKKFPCYIPTALSEDFIFPMLFTSSSFVSLTLNKWVICYLVANIHVCVFVTLGLIYLIGKVSDLSGYV